MAIEGWMPIHHGDNPAIVQQKMESLYVEAPEPPPYPASIPTADQLVQRLRDTPASHMTPAQMAPFYRDLAILRRRQGLPALRALIDVVDDPVLLAGIRASAEQSLTGDGVIDAMEACALQVRLELQRRHYMVIHGVLGIQAGDDPEAFVERVRQAAEQGVAALAAKGVPSYI